MKTTPAICAALLTLASFAHAKDDSTTSKPAAPAVATNALSTAVVKFNWPVSNSAVSRINVAGVPNFGKLNDNVWRSGQPSRDGYQKLANDGLKTVVNLREEYPHDKDLMPKGVRYVFIPVKDQHEPTEEQAKQFMEVAADPANWPVLVHCHAGEGRAGLMSALVRHSFDGWDNKLVMKEVSNFRSKPLGFIPSPIASCQRNFIQRWQATVPAKQYVSTASSK